MKKKKVQEPPKGPSPEEVQMSGIAGAIQRAEYAVTCLKDLPLSIGNFEQLNSTISWLEGVCANLKKDYEDLVKRLPPKAK